MLSFETEPFKSLHVERDESSGLTAVVSLFDLIDGAAIGGCRYASYDTLDEAIDDALRLSQAMAFKTAIAGLPFGGGKAVLRRPADGRSEDRRASFEAFGRLVDGLQGAYITGPDFGTDSRDMATIRTRTRFVTGTAEPGETEAVAQTTARSVLGAIEMAAFKSLGRSDLEGLRVAIQGVGKVGSILAEELVERGAKLLVHDLDRHRGLEIAERLGVPFLESEEILSSECDVFSPCARGGVLGEETVTRIRAKIIAGAANNQLRSSASDRWLRRHGIVYVPDFVANAGGVCAASVQFQSLSELESERQINLSLERLKDLVGQVLELSHASGRPTGEIALELAADAVRRRHEPAYEAPIRRSPSSVSLHPRLAPHPMIEQPYES